MTECGATSGICETHRPLIDMAWKLALPDEPEHCPRCGELISPVLRDNVKWTPIGNRRG
jgi:hypothetical protein